MKALGTKETGNFGCTSSDRKYICTLPKGHEPAMHEAHGAPGIILHSWPVQPSGNTPEQELLIGVERIERTGGLTSYQELMLDKVKRYFITRVAASSKEAPKWICPFCKKDKVRESELKRHIRKHVYRDRMAERIAAEATPSPAREETLEQTIASILKLHNYPITHNSKAMARELYDAGARSVVVAPQKDHAYKAAAKFVDLILGAAMEEWGGFDGAEIEDAAIASGLIEQIPVTESCGEYCRCADYGFPTECNQLTISGKAVLNMAGKLVEGAEKLAGVAAAPYCEHAISLDKDYKGPISNCPLHGDKPVAALPSEEETKEKP